MELTERDAVPDAAAIEDRDRLALRLGEGDKESATVPENPLTGATVMVEVPETRVLSGPIAVGLAFMVKSGVGGALTTNFPVM